MLRKALQLSLLCGFAPGAQCLADAIPSAAPSTAPASFADLVARVSPAVVAIDSITRLSRADLTNEEANPFAPPPPPSSSASGDEAPTIKGEALCSGFFIRASGYVVTNNHCVRNVTSLKVTLKDGREFPGKVIGADTPTDIAVIKVEGSGFPFIDFADAARPRDGDWAIAIGNPFGLSGTATAGIVSSSRLLKKWSSAVL